MRNKKYLPLYYKWLKEFPGGSGLCSAFEIVGFWYDLLDTDFLTDEEIDLKGWVCSDYPPLHSWQDIGVFNDLRQNVVLLLAAMNGEL